MHTAIIVPAEFKFAEGDGAAGTFEGYASVYGNMDSHGDVIEPGAFKDSLSELAAQKRRVPLHMMHAGVLKKDAPVGVCTSVEEDATGLRMQGKISGATNTDQGKLIYEKLRDGALPGLSIGWSKRTNGIVYGQKAGDPNRRLKSINLHEISLVDQPSNALTVVSGVKATPSDVDKAAGSVAAAMRMHDKAMKGGGYYSGSSKDQAMMMDHLRDAHEALTGSRACDGLEGWTKSIDPDALETAMREQFGLSAEEAKSFATHALREGDAGTLAIGTETKAVLDGLASFSMPEL